jgi:hypothetical protein
MATPDGKNLPTETVDDQSKPIEPQAVEAKLETPEEPFDKERAMKTIQAQREENKALKARAKIADELEAAAKKRADEELTETQREKNRADELAAKNAKLEADILRRNAIEKAGLPASFATRLQGATQDELDADAQELAKTLPQLKVAPKIPATNPAEGNANESDAQKRERLFGKQGNIFDAEAIKEKGGGVVWTK